jgi:hypothetical protein
MPEKIGQLLVLPVLARGPVAILDQVNGGYVCQILLNGTAEEAEGAITECIGPKRTVSENGKH